MNFINDFRLRNGKQIVVPFLQLRSIPELFAAILLEGGGVAELVRRMKELNPGMISPYGVQEGFMSVPWVSSFWVLVGFAVVGLPAVAQRATAPTARPRAAAALLPPPPEA